MALWLKQSTAVILKLGPFVDSTDGVTAETGLTIAQADIQISKNGGAFAQTSDAAPTTTHDADGWYPIPLTTTDTGTLGTLKVQVTMSGALPVWQDCSVVPANIWDSFFSTDKLEVDIAQWLGTACATPTVAGVPEVDVTHWIGTAAATPTTAGVPEVDVTQWLGTAVAATTAGVPNVNTVAWANAATSSGDIALVDTPTNFASLAVSAGGAVTVEALSTAGQAAVEAEVEDALQAMNLDHLVGTAVAIPALPAGTWLDTIRSDGTATYDRTTDSLQAIRDGTATAAQVADQVWDELRADHVTNLTFGQGVASVVGNVTGSVGSVTGAVGSVTGAVGSVTGDVGGNVVGSVASVTGAVGSVTGDVGGSVGSVTGAVGSVTGHVGGNVVGSVGSVTGSVGSVTGAVASVTNPVTVGTISANVVTASALAADAVNEIVDAVWDEDIIAAHSTADTAGRCLRTLDGVSDRTNNANVDALLGVPDVASTNVVDAVFDEALSGHTTSGTFGQRVQIVRTATAQAGAAGTITLDASAHATDEFYNGLMIHIVNNDPAGVQGQVRKISTYNGTTKVATVSSNWVVNPTNASVYVIYPLTVESGTGATEAQIWTYGTRRLSDATNITSDASAINTTTGVVNTVTTVTTLTGHTAQTGDSYALASGANGFANIKSDTAAILADTGTDGVLVAAAGKTGITLASGTHTGAVIPTVSTLTGHTPQTGDSYALAAGANGFANIKSDTAAILADTGTDGVLVAAAGKTGITLAGVTHTGAVIPTVTTLTGHTPQTGDTYALANGANGFVATKADTAAILADTGTDGVVVAAASKTGYTLTGVQTGVTIPNVTTCGTVTTLTNWKTVSFKRNTALNGFSFVMRDSTNHAPATGLTVSAYRSIDGAAFAACANSVAEVSNGAYTINLAAADLNGTVIMLRFVAAASDDAWFQIYTQEA